MKIRLNFPEAAKDAMTIDRDYCPQRGDFFRGNETYVIDKVVHCFELKWEVELYLRKPRNEASDA